MDHDRDHNYKYIKRTKGLFLKITLEIHYNPADRWNI